MVRTIQKRQEVYINMEGMKEMLIQQTQDQYNQK